MSTNIMAANGKSTKVAWEMQEQPALPLGLESESETKEGRLRKKGRYSNHWNECYAKIDKDSFVYRKLGTGGRVRTTRSFFSVFYYSNCYIHLLSSLLVSEDPARYKNFIL